MKALMTASLAAAFVCIACEASAAEEKPETWLRSGELGPTPKRVTDAYPLSDQANGGNWKKYELMTDEFTGKELDAKKWWPNNPSWLGRKPALFHVDNVRLADGKLHLSMKKGDVPEMEQHAGYHTYTSAAVQSKGRVLYGYFEVRCRPMASAGSSSFWFYYNDKDRWTEIDVFEIGGKAPGFERRYNMNVHVFKTPAEKRHWSSHGRWTSPADLADAFHVYGLEWNRQKIRWYFDGVEVRWVENTHWHQPTASTTFGRGSRVRETHIPFSRSQVLPGNVMPRVSASLKGDLRYQVGSRQPGIRGGGASKTVRSQAEPGNEGQAYRHGQPSCGLSA